MLRFRTFVRKAITLVALNLLTLGVLWAMLEVGLRLTGVWPPGLFTTIRYENDPATGPWPLPSQVGMFRAACFNTRRISINRFGMRDRDREIEGRGPRVALIGDSFTQAFQVEDDQTVSRRLEHLVPGVEVLNFGMNNTGTSVELLRYRARVRIFHPDVVLLLLYLGNDLAENVPALVGRYDPVTAKSAPFFTLDADGQLSALPTQGQWRRTSTLAHLLSRSAVGAWLYQLYALARHNWAGDIPGAPAGAVQDEAALMETAWRITTQVLQRFHDEVERDGAHFGLVVIPKETRTLVATGQVTTQHQADVARLARIAAQSGFPLLDLGGMFAADLAREPSLPLSLACDDHWSPTGHARAAAAIAQFLRTTGWLQ